MKKWRVEEISTGPASYGRTYEVEAETEQEARRMVEESEVEPVSEGLTEKGWDWTDIISVEEVIPNENNNS